MAEPEDSQEVWAKVDAQGDCWIWTGAVNRDGYGTCWYRGKKWLAHRLIWSLLIGPPGPTLDHRCRVHECVNPSHLEQVTRGENVLRGQGVSVQHLRKTHCPGGHPYAGENLRITVRGGRRCRRCDRQHNRNQAKRRQAQRRGA